MTQNTAPGSDSHIKANDGRRTDRWALLVHQQPLVLMVVAAAVGVLVDNICDESLKPAVLSCWIGLTLVSLLTMSACCLLPPRKTYLVDEAMAIWPRLSLLSVTVLVMSISGINQHWQDLCYRRCDLLQLIDVQPSAAVVEGTVCSTPTLKPNPFAFRDARSKRDGDATSAWTTSLVLAVDHFRIGQDMHPTDGNLILSIGDRCDDLRPGDRIRAYGSIKRADSPTNPGSRDWVAADRRRNTHGRLDVDLKNDIELISSGSGKHFAGRIVATIAVRGRDVLLDQLSETTGPLAVALVLGQRDFVDLETRDQLLVTGTAHLLSVSGMHLAIVVSLALFLAAAMRLPVFWKVVFTIAVCVFYTALTGGRPPVLRAAILVCTFTVAIWMRRPSQAINTLSLAGLLLIFLNPENLFSVGVQLSFLAVGTLLLSSGRLNRRSQAKSIDMALENEERLAALAEESRSRPVYYLRVFRKLVVGLLWMSLCVTAVAAPLVWHQFHVLSIISVVTNVLLGPLVFVALASGLVTIIGGFIHPWVAWPAAVVCHATIWIMRWVIVSAASIPMGHVWLPAPPTTWVVLFYVGLAATLLMQRSFAARCIRVAWIVCWLLVAFVLATRPTDLPDESVELTFVDVGHGTCVVIRSDDEVWLYDCGKLGNDAGNSRDIEQVLWSLRVCKLDGIFLSHADSDHFNALPGIVRRFEVKQVVTPPGMLGEPEAALKPIVEAIHRHTIPTSELSVGGVVEIGDTVVQALHPPAVRIRGSDNANSLVLRLDHSGTAILLPGDLEPPGTNVMTRQNRPRPGGVMMAPHHGSLAMDAAMMLNWARPAETIVSGGRLAKRPEVAAMLAQQGSRVHVTALSGAIRVRILGDGTTRIRSWRESPW